MMTDAGRRDAPDRSQTKKRPRYPGTYYFEDNDIDRKIFFGRKTEAKTLINEIRSTRLLVLYGKSGLGKTSLLNAGVFPLLRQRNLLPLRLRLNDLEHDLLTSIFAEIGQLCADQDIDYSAGETSSLWAFFKTALFWRGEILETPVALFDQFEEVFTLRTADERTRLAEQLGELMSGGLPQAIRERIQAGETLDYSQSPPNVKLIISLRSEYVGQLEELFPQIPAILSHRFLLKPLDRERAREAITLPARQTGDDFISPDFAYQPGALTCLLNFLTSEEGAVEPFQLQLICQHIEQQVVRDYRPGREILIDERTLGDEDKLKAVLGDFYLKTVNTIKNPRTRRAVRDLCEYGLLSPQGHRLDLGLPRILDEYPLTEADLDYLVNQRLLRREPRLGHYSYELAHDSLAASIFRHRRFKMPRWAKWLGGSAALLGVVLIFMSLMSLVEKHKAQIESFERRNITEQRFTELLAENKRLNEQVTLVGEQATLWLQEISDLEAALLTGGDTLNNAVSSLLSQTEAFNFALEQTGILTANNMPEQSIKSIREPEMVVIPAGHFWMGSDPKLDKGSYEDEQPHHEVIIEEPFWIGKYEVTFEEYDTFALATGRDLPSDEGWGRGQRPVINVSWDDAVAYAEWLSEQTGKLYRLPTEAEWEYAARAGTETPYWWGDRTACDYANAADLSAEKQNPGWKTFDCDDGFVNTAPADRQIEPNNFGLYDMSGNVWEWVQDCWHHNYEVAPTDGSAREGEEDCLRVLRGGSWSSEPQTVRSAARHMSSRTNGFNLVGFRLARSK